jgi:Zn-dependent M16 (insulinase) family peptidase
VKFRGTLASDYLYNNDKRKKFEGIILMGTWEDQRHPDWKIGDRIEGYQLQRVEKLEGIQSIYYELTHVATGAKHVHISNNDQENTFSVAFKTVPQDSTGVAHILEHTVLCGSEKFPVRDPFFSMLKRSLSTFMNAFTASDWTMYPFSTQNQKDYYNLMDVYLDATFFPKLEELSFKQEGHRLELENNGNDSNGSPLVYKGVVYNEMKGAMSSPDQVMVRSLMNALYPDTTYSNNSGGDPAIIPQLTYNQLKAFHQRHYHPSNAYFYTYGDLPLASHLAFIEKKVLNHFQRIDPQTDVPSQPRWQSAQERTYYYPLGENDDPSKKCQVSVGWLMADIKDTFEVLVLTLLEQILLGNSAAPLHKALIESELGTALSDGTGFVPDTRDTMFTVGLKDVEADAAPQIENIIMGVLEALATRGIDPQLIDSAIHQLEFQRKEVTNHPYPYGIKLLLFFCGSWLHGGDPVGTFQIDDDLKQLAKERASGPFFENRIRHYFIENPHRVLFKLLPDQKMEHKENQRVAAELKERRNQLSQASLEQIHQEAVKLQALQEKKEDVSSLPTLALTDIPPSIHQVAPDTIEKDLSIACYDQPTSGILYFSGAVGAGLLSRDQLPLVPFFCYAFKRIGTQKRDYTDIVRMIDAYTGGFNLAAHARRSFQSDGAGMPFVTINGKCLNRNIDPMFDLVKELLFAFDFGNLDHLKNLLLEYRAQLEAMVIHNGHRLAMMLAARHFSKTNMLNEIWHGIHQLQTIKQVSEDLSDEKLTSLAQRLTQIGNDLFSKQPLRMALIGEEAALQTSLNQGRDIARQIMALNGPKSTDGFVLSDLAFSSDLPHEGWSTSTAVSFVASAFETARMSDEDAPALAVIGKILRSMYLHREIREKGGAYGGFSLYSPEDGIFSFGSYRDPHIVDTLKAFDGAAAFIQSGDYSAEDVKEAILQVCSEIDKPDPPGPSARKAFYRNLVSLTDELRAQYKSKLLALTKGQVLKVAKTYFGDLRSGTGVAVISNEGKIKAANDQMGGHPLSIKEI